MLQSHWHQPLLMVVWLRHRWQRSLQTTGEMPRRLWHQLLLMVVWLPR